MIVYILGALFTITLINSAFLFVNVVEKIPPKKNQQVLKELRSKRDLIQWLMQDIVLPLANLIKPFIKLSEKDETILDMNLKRAGIEEDAKLYYAKAIASALITIPLVFLFLLIGSKFFAIIASVLAIAIFVNGLERYKIVLEKKKGEIERAIPSFIRSILYKLASDDESTKVKANLVEIFESYLSVCPKVFVYDISVLIYDLKTTDNETALREFNKRLGIVEVSYLVNALIGIIRGERQNDVLKDLAKEMSIKNRQAIQRELEKRPAKVFRACIPLFVIAFVAIIYVLVSALADGFSTLI